ncbi:MAG: PHP domain-containing protein [Limisphaerales bacterium]
MRQFCILLLALAATSAHSARWYKGNLHTHSLWSDGDHFPEMIAGIYKENGYDFLTITDHNIMHDVEKWIPVTKERSRDVAYEKYLKQWGKDWVKTRKNAKGQLEVRLKHYSEYEPKLNEPGKFLLIKSEEVTARFLTSPVHINAANIQYKITPETGDSVYDVMQKNVDAILAHGKKTGRPVLPHINHPNFGWAVTAEELMRVRGENFFEVYNGHPSVRNRGDATHAGLEKVWDIINARRLTELNLPLMFGLATDDTHNYHQTNSKKSNGLRGWVQVRAEELSAKELIAAMKRGDFYSSTGVILRNVNVTKTDYHVSVKPEKGVNYTIQFIGTLKGYDRTNTPIHNKAGEKLRLTHRYSEDVGEVLKEVKGSKASYKFKGNELYVRAKVISDKPQTNPINADDLEVAWTQPVRP